MTEQEWRWKRFQIEAIGTLCAAYEDEHNWDIDEDPCATFELLLECRALAARLLTALPKPDPSPPAQIAADPDIPF